MKRLVFSVIFLLVVVVPYLPLAHGAGGTGWQVIVQVVTDDTGTRLLLDSPHTNPDACAIDSAVMLLATALSAFYAGNEVSFYLTGCITHAGTTWPQVSRISVR
jgi:hypothetical protein